MSKRPSFQFYPKDWRNNANLRRCSAAARGAWMDIMCILHDTDEYGLVRWPLKDLAAAAGATMQQIKELVDRKVLKGVERGEVEPFVYTPRHGRALGDPVVLIPAQPGPLWYSSRMVKDEYVRMNKGKNLAFDEEVEAEPSGDHQRAANPPQNTSPQNVPMGGIGEESGRGIGALPSSSSSSSTPVIEKETLSRNPRASPPDDGFPAFWDTYDKKIDLAKCKTLWGKLKPPERAAIMQVLPRYVASTPDKQYRKHPKTWLTGKCWQDESLQAAADPPAGTSPGAVASVTDPNDPGKVYHLRDFPGWHPDAPFDYSNISRYRQRASLKNADGERIPDSIPTTSPTDEHATV